MTSLDASLKRLKIVWEREPKILLSPNIPKPMHGMAPRVVLGRVWWDKTRKEAYKSTAYHCKTCGVHKFKAKGRKWLEGHELYEVDYLLGRMYYLKTVPLCHYCHNYIHSGRLAAMLEAGDIHQSKFVAIIQHGDRVLTRAGLAGKIREEYSGPEADWEDWRLVVEGKEYLPKFKTFAQWRKAFGV